MTKPTFKLPNRGEAPAAALDQWVSGGAPTAAEATPAAPATRPERAQPAAKPARLTIDLPPELHMQFKTACVRNQTKMVDEVRRFIEEWTQKHS